MIMKMSQYNIFTSTNNGKYVYNSFSGSVIELDSNHISILESGEIAKLTAEEICLLTKQGIIISDECDEKKLIKYFFNKSRYGNNTLSITIVPTLECNFSCPYCYEKEIKGRMPKENWQAILNFIQNCGNKFEYINITFYGGEPLLELKAIYDFLNNYSRLAPSICKKTTFDMVTNGYLLSKDVVEKLNYYGVYSYQITIDGDEETHNKRRPHKKKSDSYQVITKNIHDALSNSKISIRSNIDIDNSDFDVKSLLSDIGFPSGHKNLHLYTGILVDEDSETDFNIHTNSSFSKCYLENHEKALSNNATPFTSSTFHLSPKELFCGADLESCYCFLPSGKIVNCWNHMSSDQEVNDWMIGEIKDGKVSVDLVKLANWMESTSITSISSECENCKLLPICLSGCPKARATNEKDCCYPKYWLSEYINSFATLHNDQNNTESPTFI